eukprot:768101-Hanusia_phi.AAC.2
MLVVDDWMSVRKLDGDDELEAFCWDMMKTLREHVIGTLMAGTDKFERSDDWNGAMVDVCARYPRSRRMRWI